MFVIIATNLYILIICGVTHDYDGSRTRLTYISVNRNYTNRMIEF